MVIEYQSYKRDHNDTTKSLYEMQSLYNGFVLKKFKKLRELMCRIIQQHGHLEVKKKWTNAAENYAVHSILLQYLNLEQITELS